MSKERIDYGCSSHHEDVIHEKPLATREEDRPWVCKPCGKNFKTRKGLKKHEWEVHKNQNSIACEFCEKRFKTNSCLRSHMRMHSEERPFSCTSCCKSYKRKKDLKYHEKTHSDMKPFSCDLCAKPFKSRSHLEIHMTTHSDEKPFICEKCLQSFKTKTNLKRHMDQFHWRQKLEEDIFPCSICARTFETRGNLNIQNHRENIDGHVPAQNNAEVPGRILDTTPRRLRMEMTTIDICSLFDSTEDQEGFNGPIEHMVQQYLPEGVPEIVGELASNMNESPVEMAPWNTVVCLCECSDGMERIDPIERPRELTPRVSSEQVHEDGPLPGFGELKKFSQRCRQILPQNGIQSIPGSRSQFTGSEVLRLRENLDRTSEYTLPFLSEPGPSGISRSLSNHNESPSKTSKDGQKKTKNREECLSDQGFLCEVCGKKFSFNHALVRHMRIHANDGCNRCQFCAKSFKYKQGLERHLRRDHDKIKSFLCGICGERFECNQDLRNHKGAHLEMKSFSCKFCSKTYKYKKDLENHNRLHTGERFHSCELCGENFHCQRNLRRHINSHEIRKPFPCNFCIKSFQTQSHLRDHILGDHPQEGLVPCDFCNRCFKMGSELWEHMKIHIIDDEPRFTCDLCCRNFKKNFDLKRHMGVHRGEKKFQCHICAKIYNRRSHLNRHLKIHTDGRQLKCKSSGKSIQCEDKCEKNKELSQKVKVRQEDSGALCIQSFCSGDGSSTDDAMQSQYQAELEPEIVTIANTGLNEQNMKEQLTSNDLEMPDQSSNFEQSDRLMTRMALETGDDCVYIEKEENDQRCHQETEEIFDLDLSDTLVGCEVTQTTDPDIFSELVELALGSGCTFPDCEPYESQDCNAE
ncbi:hypothetical protein QAD02_009636 [Eretmocerus hayati]|uniref:Uncharacterized protein n=1 Tax=Eretmocerus hayati TaxID=131215 RepID=A0ACC2NA05_9HYME|nr:hypothetical protein QAD02_009636 [Eretmocerus hayati]